MTTTTNGVALTPEVIDRVAALADGSAARPKKDGGALRAARREQAEERRVAAKAKEAFEGIVKLSNRTRI